MRTTSLTDITECSECQNVEPLQLSWSALRRHDECRMKAKLYRQGVKSASSNIRGYFHGTVCDRVMRDWLNDPQPGQMPDMVTAYVDKCLQEAVETGDGIVRWKHANDKTEMTKWCRELVTRLEPILQRYVLPFEYEQAKRFKVPLEIPNLVGEPTTVLLVGEIDLLCRDNKARWGLWDLKATEDDGYWRKTVAQLTFYDLCVEAMFDNPTYIAGLIQPMCKQPVLPVKITEIERAELLARVVTMAHTIWKEDFALAEKTAICNYCEVRHACPKFNPVRTGEPLVILSFDE